MENLDIITLFSDYKQVCLERLRESDASEVCMNIDMKTIFV